MKEVYQNEWNRQNHGSDLCRLSRKGKAGTLESIPEKLESYVIEGLEKRGSITVENTPL